MTMSPPDPAESGGEEPTRVDPLSTDRLLRTCARSPWKGVERPVLGQILITAPVGKGGMGAVYRGVHRTLGQERAVKVLLGSADDSLRERFLREARFAANIDSPHLVRVHDADEDAASGLVYLEMEYVRGISASQWMRQAVASGKSGVPEKDALTVCLAACRGLEAAHAAGVIHRDLKPGNILLPEGPGGHPVLTAAKVADLGLARSEGGDASLTETNTFVGTPGFAAPEQIADAKRAGRPADVFAMGATLYALLSGHSPFDGSSSSDTVVRTTLGKLKPLPELRRGLSAGTLAIIHRCLSMNPADRYPDAAALSEAIESHMRGAEPPSTVGAPWADGPSEAETIAGAVGSPPPGSAPPTPAPVFPVAAQPAANSASKAKVAAWIGAAVVVAGIAAAVLRGGANGSDGVTGTPAATATPPGTGGASGAIAEGMAAVRLGLCPPGSTVEIGEREVHDGDLVPRASGTARVTLGGFNAQTVLFSPDEKGEIWIRPAEFRSLPGRLVIAKLPDIQAFLDGKPVSGSLAAEVGEQVTIEFRMRGYYPQSLTEMVPVGDPVILQPQELWVWSGLIPLDLARGAKLRFEIVNDDGDGTADAGGDTPTPAEVEWEAECLSVPPAASKLRLRVTRILGRVLGANGATIEYDSADTDWASVLAAHEVEIARAAPLALLQHGPIDVVFGGDGRPSSWAPFPADAAGLPGIDEGTDDEIRRSVIGLLTLRPDITGVEPFGGFSYTGSDDADTARLFGFRRVENTQIRSKLVVSVRDGLGTLLEIETKVSKQATKRTARRK